MLGWKKLSNSLDSIKNNFLKGVENSNGVKIQFWTGEKIYFYYNCGFNFVLKQFLCKGAPLLLEKRGG
jgi:hypothetical protein